MTHRLILSHSPWWRAECSCGWIGVPRRHTRAAVKQHRQHVRSLSSPCGTWRVPCHSWPAEWSVTG